MPIIPPSLAQYYTEHSAMSSPGPHADLFRALPHGVHELVTIVQHLVIYDVVAGDFYGADLPAERLNEIHVRRVAAMLDAICALDASPLTVPREPGKRIAGRCRQFTILLASMLRAKGIPARLRVGFGAYFNPPLFEDHWVCEYWSAQDGRWMLADPQFDDVWRSKLRIRHDVLDVPRDQFLVASDAWRSCRAGDTDPDRFGIEFAGLRGLWFVAGSLVREVAALNKVEMLPWDVWGAQPKPNERLDDARLEWFDHLADLTRQPDATLVELQSAYRHDIGLHVADTVFNSLLEKPERV